MCCLDNHGTSRRMQICITLANATCRSYKLLLTAGILLSAGTATAATTRNAFQVTANVSAGCAISVVRVDTAQTIGSTGSPAAIRSDCVRNTQAVIGYSTTAVSPSTQPDGIRTEAVDLTLVTITY